MKHIDYTLSLFKKAVKRNEPKLIHFQDSEFWFITQKAVISFSNFDSKLENEIKRWIFSQHYKVELMKVDKNGFLVMEFVKYEK